MKSGFASGAADFADDVVNICDSRSSSSGLSFGALMAPSIAAVWLYRRSEQICERTQGP